MVDSKPLVLVVDDDEQTQAVMEIQLQRSGFKSVKKYGAREALQWLEGNSPDVIVTDVMMPEMDGFEFCRHVRKIDRYKTTPIIVVSALQLLRHDNSYGFDAGATEVITKPYTEAELRNSIRHVLGQDESSKISAPSVLITEDDKNLQRAFRKALEMRGFEVKVAGEGSEALDILEAYVPDVIVLDMNMPGLSGHKTIQLLKADSRLANIKVIVVTGIPLDASHETAKAADVVLQKPVSTRELAEWVTRVT